MLRLSFLLPSIIVSGIILLLGSLYFNNKVFTNQLESTNKDLEKKLADSESLIRDNLQKIRELEGRLAKSDLLDKAPIKAPSIAIELIPTPSPPVDSNNHSSTAPKSEAAQQQSINAKISAISKFIPLTEEQISRLKTKYSQEADPNNQESEKLEDIIGKDNAAFYREQRKKAFERVLQESIEKEVLYISRKLALEETQEEALKRAYFNVEELIKQRREQIGSQNKSTLDRLIEEEKMRSTLLSEQTKNILEPEKYDEYLQLQNGSQDMQLWHEK